MKSTSTLKTLFLGLIVLFSVACNNNENDYYKEIIEWKNLNDSYFANMKDSASYQKFEIAAEKGGGIFYYQILAEGDTTLASPALTSEVVVNYRGSLINKIVFDKTYNTALPTTEEAKPATFRVNRLIEGWRENLILMKPGETRRIVLPAYLGYGHYDMGTIKPYSTLRFDIQLVSVKATNE
jgi:FKBP-type peptidyl-prolyl cis-trans isomerase FklB